MAEELYEMWSNLSVLVSYVGEDECPRADKLFDELIVELKKSKVFRRVAAKHMRAWEKETEEQYEREMLERVLKNVK